MSIRSITDGLPSVAAVTAMSADERRAVLHDQVMPAINDAMDALTARAKSAGRQMLASESRDFDALSDLFDEYAAADRELRRSELEQVRSEARPAERMAYRRHHALTERQTMAGYVRARGLADDTEGRLDMGKVMRGIAVGDWTGADDERRAMGEGTGGAGGYMVPASLSADIIDLARAKAAVLSAGARLVPMEAPTVDTPRWLSDPTAAWRNEHELISDSEPTMDKITLTAKSLAGLVIVSRELIEDAVVDTGARITEAFASVFGLKIDDAALHGSGTAPEPRGLLNQTGVTVTSLGTNGATPTWASIVSGVGTLQDANENPSGIVWHPRTARTLENIVDTVGQYVAAPATLAGIRRYATTAIPVNKTTGTATNTSEAFIGDWSQLVVGVRTQMLVRPLVERYAEYGQVGFLCWWRGDVAVTRPAAFTVLTGIKP